MSSAVHSFPIPPVIKTVFVACNPEIAFRAFTTNMGRWYPLDRYSINPAVDCRLEPHIGGRLYEVAADGEETIWGHVLEWDEPNSIAFAWQARVGEDEAQRIDISFRGLAGGTEVQLIHSGWERLKIDAALWRDKYDGGWVEVFERCFKAFADNTT